MASTIDPKIAITWKFENFSLNIGSFAIKFKSQQEHAVFAPIKDSSFFSAQLSAFVGVFVCQQVVAGFEIVLECFHLRPAERHADHNWLKEVDHVLGFELE